MRADHLARLALACAAVILLPGIGLGTAGPKESPGRNAGTEPPPVREEPDAYARALSLYRSERIPEAASVLEEAIRAGKGDAGHRSLLGWCFVRMHRYDDAAAQFREAIGRQPASWEARHGLATALVRGGKPEEALDLALAMIAEDAGNADALAVAGQALAAAGAIEDRRLRADAPRRGGAGPLVPARSGTDYLEVRSGERYLPIFVKGVNLGVALPGRFPAEFPPESETYREWLRQIAGMGANAVRLYTLLPPAFYRALFEHNTEILAGSGFPRDASAPPRGFIWLIQGVWTELPEEDRYDDPAFSGAFREEIDRILDVLHGNIAVARRPGHAFGLYRHDVSAMTLALILGREWEPFSVEAYDRLHPDASFSGRYFSVEEGTAMEAWVASVMDHAVDHEMRRYGSTHPVAFTNWPTLDPLHHPTEATKAEEIELARKAGEPAGGAAIREYDNDGVSVDANRIRASAEALAGHFASYHAYPYYPDFMNLDPGYLQARDRHGANNYVGYLTDLRKHHRGLPVLISEIGVPTSRGVSHIQPQGFHHGGHNEEAQGEINARLMENIHDSGCAGGILFAWLDEWFKRNWLVMEFELPYERNPKWHNALDPEQNYGLLAAEPGDGRAVIVLDGEGADWEGRAPLAARDDPGEAGATGARLKALWAAHDEASLFLRVDVEGWNAGGGDGDRPELLIGIDVYGEAEGDRRFPTGVDLRAPTGMEFMVQLGDEDSGRLLVDPPYDLHTHRYNRPYRSVPNDDGIYMEIRVETNRRRRGRDGTVYPAVMHNRSPLRFGTTDPNAPGYDDLADWFAHAGSGIVEIRLPWGLLNVTDPSSHRVVEDRPDASGGVGTRETEGFRFYAALWDPREGEVLDTLPALDPDGRIASTPSTLFRWPGWEEPTFHTRLKRSYFILRDRLAGLPDLVSP